MTIVNYHYTNFDLSIRHEDEHNPTVQLATLLSQRWGDNACGGVVKLTGEFRIEGSWQVELTPVNEYEAVGWLVDSEQLDINNAFVAEDRDKDRNLISDHAKYSAWTKEQFDRYLHLKAVELLHTIEQQVVQNEPYLGKG